MNIAAMLTTLKRVKETSKDVSMLLIIPMAVMGINVIGVLSGGLLGPAILAGVVFTLSFCFILLNMGLKKMIIVRNFVASYAGWVDLIQTVFLTWLGFHLGGVILALTMTGIGLNLSGCFSLLRLWAVCTSDKHRKEYREEMAG